MGPRRKSKHSHNSASREPEICVILEHVYVSLAKALCAQIKTMPGVITMWTNSLLFWVHNISFILASCLVNVWVIQPRFRSFLKIEFG